MSEPTPASESIAPPATTRRPRWMMGCGALLALALAALVGAGITFWWLNRPMKPVVLTEPEIAAVEKKLEPPPRADNTYEPGEKSLVLTEREVNGMLEHNTGLGNRIRLSLDRGAVNAYLAIPLPEDLPMLGGMLLRGRGRFLVDASAGQNPRLQLEDVTLFGLSLPAAWLGGLKGRDLLAESLGTGNMPGIRELVVEPGSLRIELEE